MEGKKARPRGLKRSMLDDAHADGNKRQAVGTEAEEIHEERVELPEELQDEEGENDGYSLFNAALIEIEKDNLEIAGKFLEGAIHELQTQYEATETPDLTLLHTLGLAWCELGIVTEQEGYMDRGVSFLRDAAAAAPTEADPCWDLARMLLGKHSMRHQTEETAEVTADEEAQVKEALECIDKCVELTADESKGASHLRAAELVREYAQSQEPARLLVYAQKADDYYAGHFDALSSNEGEAKALAGRALNCTDMAEAQMSMQAWEAARGLFEAAMAHMRKALGALRDKEDDQDRAEYLKLLGEMHVNLGDICARLDEDDASEQHYRDAQAKVLEARALWPEAVTEDLVQTMHDLVNGAGDASSGDE